MCHGGAGWRSGGKGSLLRGWEPVPPYAEVIHSKQQSQDFWNRTCNILVFAAVLLSLRDSQEQRGNGRTPPQEGPRHRTRGTDQVEAAMQRTVSRLTSEAQEKDRDRKRGLQRPEHLDSPQRPASPGPCTCAVAGAPFSPPPCSSPREPVRGPPPPGSLP